MEGREKKREKIAPRGVSRAEHFRKRVFGAARARPPKYRGKGSLEMPFFPAGPARARGGRGRAKEKGKAPRVEILLNTGLCDRGPRRNRGVGSRGGAFRAGALEGGNLWQNWRFPPALAFGAFSDREKPVLASKPKRGVGMFFSVRRESAKSKKTSLFGANPLRSTKRVLRAKTKKTTQQKRR